MTTQYTTILKLALPVQGELSGTWGDVVNDNITSMVEEAVAGRKVIDTWTANSHTLTTADGTTSESRAAILTLTDTGTALTGAGTVVCPALSKVYIVENGTAQVITIKTSGGTGIAVPVGRNMVVFCDGTNVEEGISNIASLSIGGDGATVTGIKDEDDMSSDSATKLATQQSIKAYVDSQVGANNELSEVLANGNTTGGTDISVSTGDDITFADSSKAIFGAGSDLEIYHDGSDSYVDDAGVGDLVLRGNNQVLIRDTGTNEVMGNFRSSGAVTLYYDNAEKISTTSTGIDVTGVITTDGMTTSADINFGDNDKAIFGAGDDLQIYHDGTRSYISDSGTGDLRLRASEVRMVNAANTEVGFKFVEDGAASLYFNANEKLATTSTGIDVTGSVTADGATIAGTLELDSNSFKHTALTPSYNFIESDVTGENTQFLQASGTLRIRTVDDSVSNPVERLRIDHATGDISFYEDTGTTPKFFWDSSAESLGIGTTSPTAILDVRRGDASGKIAEFHTSTGFGVEIGSSQAEAYIQAGSSQALLFNTNVANERMRITSAGNVGIGTTSPDEALEVSGDLKISGSNFGIVQFGETSDQTKIVGRDSSHASLPNTMEFFTSSVNRMVIDSSGNVGIGTSSPNYNLTSYKAGANANYLQVANGSTGVNSANGTLFGVDASGNGIVNVQGAFDLITSVAGAERMRIDSSGNVGIGTTSPGSFNLNINGAGDGGRQLKVEGTGTNGLMRFSNSTAQDYSIGINSSSFIIYDDTASSYRMVVDSSGNVGIGTSSPVNNTNKTTLGLQGAWGGQLDIMVGSTVHAQIGSDNFSSGQSCRIQSQDGIVFKAGGPTEVMRIDSAGSVGIGVTPSSLWSGNDVLQLNTYSSIAGSSSFTGLSSNLAATSSGWAVKYIQNGRGLTYLQDIAGGTHRWYSAASGTAGNVATINEAMRIDASGDLLLGTTSASGTSGQGIKLRKVSSDGVLHIVGSTSTIAQDALQVYSTGASAYRFFVQYNGQVNATSSSINAISDASLKQNIRDLDKGLEAILALQPRRFDWINGDGNDIMGFVAQEVETVLPELVHDYKYSEEETKLGLKMGDMIPTLVKAIQEQQETITALTARITQLENN